MTSGDDNTPAPRAEAPVDAPAADAAHRGARQRARG